MKRLRPMSSSSVEVKCPSLLQACEHCDCEMVQMYLNAGVSADELNAQDNTGKTGLAHACANGFMNIIKQLKPQFGLDVNLSDNEGNSPLIFAAQAGHHEIVRYLLNNFSTLKIDQRNRQGFTALMKAAIQGRTTCAKILLLAGASPFKRDSGRSLCALEWAEYCNRQQCASTLKQYMDIYPVDIRRFAVEGEDDVFAPTCQRCQSEFNLKRLSDASDDTVGSLVGCFPARSFIKRVRRTLSSSSSSSSRHLLLYENMEDIVRCLSSPVIPEQAREFKITPIVRRRRVQIPKVEVTKDDSYIDYECLSGCSYSKYLVENLPMT